VRELMIHVERIVRPVRAMESRKLRMRRELLAHLESALREEQTAGGSEGEILQRAKARLGDPAALTMELQQSVPSLDRLLLHHIPVLDALEQPHWSTSKEPLTGLRALDGGPLGQALLLAGAGGVLPVLAAAVTITLLARRTSSGVNLGIDHPRVLIAAAGLLICALPALCTNFVTAMAGLSKPPRWSRAVAYGAGVVAAQLLWTSLMAVAMLDLAPAAHQLLYSALLALAVLVVLSIAARAISALRLRYDAWLTLDIGE
jgi:hypothetical protein